MQNLSNLIVSTFIRACEQSRKALTTQLRKRLVPKLICAALALAVVGGGTAYAVHQNQIVIEQQQQLHVLQVDLETLRDEHETVVKKAEELDKQKTELEDQNEQLRSDKADLEERNTDLEEALQAKREAQSRAQTQIAVASAPSGTCADWIAQAGVTDISNAYWLIMRESGCNVYATNASSGAYGIPQALPGSKMASAGSDWQTNPITQIRWMDGYVKGRYGGWAQAVAFWQTHHWY